MQTHPRTAGMLALAVLSLTAHAAAAATLASSPYEHVATGNVAASFGTVPQGQVLVLSSLSCMIQATGLQGQTTELSWGIGPSNRKTIYLPQVPVYGTGSAADTSPVSYQVNLSFLGFVHAGEQVSVSTQTYRFLQPAVSCTLAGYSMTAS